MLGTVKLNSLTELAVMLSRDTRGLEVAPTALLKVNPVISGKTEEGSVCNPLKYPVTVTLVPTVPDSGVKPLITGF